MATVFDYLEWRGDIGFDQSAFNQVDALIFSWLSYYEFENLQEVYNKTVAEVAKLHIASFGEFQKINITNAILPQTSATWLLYCASQTERYSKVIVKRGYAVKDLTANVQFSATTFNYAADKICIAYRGTDGSVAGWKEDFMLSYATDLPAQRYALSYLEDEELLEDKIIVGHSKGGNLAMYSALHCEDKTLETIRFVYNFDGPGFFNDILLNADRYKTQLRDKIISIVPKSSIIGMLLNHEDDYLVVDSEMVSMIQHNALFWKIKGASFVYIDKRTISSEVIDATVSAWINSLDLEKRETIVNNLFSIIESTGISDFSQLTDNMLKNILLMVRELTKVSKEDRDMITRVLFRLGGIGTANISQVVVNNDIVNNISNDIEDTVSSLSESIQQGKHRFLRMIKKKKDDLFSNKKT